MTAPAATHLACVGVLKQDIHLLLSLHVSCQSFVSSLSISRCCCALASEIINRLVLGGPCNSQKHSSAKQSKVKSPSSKILSNSCNLSIRVLIVHDTSGFFTPAGTGTVTLTSSLSCVQTNSQRLSEQGNVTSVKPTGHIPFDQFPPSYVLSVY